MGRNDLGFPTKNMSVLVPVSTHRLAVKKAKELRVPVSWVVREALSEYLGEKR